MTSIGQAKCKSEIDHSVVELKSCKPVDPENAIGIEITELIGVGFSGHVRDVALVSAIISRVFLKSGANLQTEVLALRQHIVLLQRQTPKLAPHVACNSIWGRRVGFCGLTGKIGIG